MRHVAERSRLVRPLVDRFVAGALERDAVATARRLTDEHLLVTLDYLGEDVVSADHARATVAAYRSILNIVAANGLGPHVEVSLKLSARGQSLPTGGEQHALDGALAICAAAAEADTTVTLDAEDHTTISSTLDIHSRARAEFPWLGIAIQAYLKRAEADCQDLAKAGCRVVNGHVEVPTGGQLEVPTPRG
jgi:proline dehydrogenase